MLNVADCGVYPDREQDQTALLLAALGNMGKTVGGIEYARGFILPMGRYCFDWRAVAEVLRAYGPLGLSLRQGGILFACHAPDERQSEPGIQFTGCVCSNR
jgi:hypothetical protein